LLGKMPGPPSSQPKNTLTIAEGAGAPMLVPNEARPHRGALATSRVPTLTPNVVSPTEHNPGARSTPAPNEAWDHRDALAVAPVPTPAPNTTSPTEHFAGAAMTPGPERPSDRERDLAHRPGRSVTPSAEQGSLQSPGKEGRSEAAVRNPHTNEVRPPIVQPKVQITSRSDSEPVTEHLAISTEPVSRAPAGSVRDEASVPQRLLLARAALVNRDQFAARSLMEEVQTMIVFQPENVPSRRSSTAASQITAALMMLGHGDEAGALQRLNQAIAAIQPVS